MKEAIRQFGHEVCIDAVGFAAIEDDHSPQSPDARTILPDGLYSLTVQLHQMRGCLSSLPRCVVREHGVSEHEILVGLVPGLRQISRPEPTGIH